MTSSQDEPLGPGGPEDVTSGEDTKPTGPTGLPDKGYISDEQLPEDLQPTDDNPLAKDPGDSTDDGDGEDDGDQAEPARVEGMPDLGDPGDPGGPG